MKDKIAYTIIGILVILVLLLLVKTDNPVAQQDTAVFNNVLIKGSLTIEKGNNKILLENKDGKSNIIIKTKGCGIILSTKEGSATVLISAEVLEKNNIGLPNGISIHTDKDKTTGKTSSLIYLADDNGNKVTTTTD